MGNCIGIDEEEHPELRYELQCPNGTFVNQGMCVVCIDGVVTEEGICTKCKPGYKPNENKTECISVYANNWPRILLVFGCVFMIVVVFIIAIIIHFVREWMKEIGRAHV